MTMASSNTMSTAPRSITSLRKTNKPLMEKRRRARINDSLTQLKSLVIQSSKKDSSQFNKLEKADILELTVKHLRSLQDQQQQHISQANKDASLVGKYQAGFMECANEVIRYLGQSQGFSDDTKSRVVHHLASCIQLSSKSSFTKPVQSSNTVTNSNIISSPLHATNGQLTNGQVIQIVNSQFPVKSNGGFPGTQPVSLAPVAAISSAPAYNPAAVTSVTTSATLPEPQSYIKYTQPLQIQIPAVLSPVPIQPKPVQPQNPSKPQVFHQVQNIAPQVISHHTNPKQETLIFSNSPQLQSRDTPMSTLPLRISQKPQSHYRHEDQYSELIPRSRTYSHTSTSSESELSSPLNLSHSPQYYTHRDVNNNQYPSPVDSHYIQTSIQSDKISGIYSKDGLYFSHCPPSSCTSVIVDGRKTVDGHAMRYMHFMEEDSHFIRHEGSTSPASSVGEERLWRPW